MTVNPEIGKPEHDEYRWVSFDEAKKISVQEFKKLSIGLNLKLILNS